MSSIKQCVICSVELQKPIMLGETAPKGWAKKHGYDGYQWSQCKDIALAILKDAREELFESSPTVHFPDSVTFFTCMKHTDKNFDTVGEAAEVNED